MKNSLIRYTLYCCLSFSIGYHDLHNDQPPVGLIGQLVLKGVLVSKRSLSNLIQSFIFFLLLFYITDASVDPIDLWSVNSKPEDSSRYATVCQGPSLPSISCIVGGTNHAWCLCKMGGTDCYCRV